MTEIENNCRICRGEGTEAQPLLHPCKCRGSIKYIHQDCLLEWLKHSNKSTKKCDICNTSYKFKTIYDPQMPDRMPLNFMWEKLRETVSNTVMKSLSIFLYITCLLVQVPLFWKFIGRIYTWAIDGRLPNPNSSFMDALLFGAIDDELFPISSPRFILSRVSRFVGHTYFSGFRYVSVFIIIHIALFVEHEWVVRDEGYTKLLLKKIGKEPRTKLVDILQQTLQGLRDEGAQGNEDANANLQRLESLARAINDLQDQPTNQRHEEALRRAIEDDQNILQVNDDIGFNINNDNHNISDGELSDIDSDLDDERRTIFLRPQDNAAQENRPEDIRNAEVDIQQAEADIIGEQVIGEEDRIDRNEFEDDREQAELDEAVAAAAANNAANGDIFELLGMKLNVSTPLLLMLLCDIIISVYLFVTYLIPHMIGNFIVSTIRYLILVFNSGILSYLYSLGSFNKLTSKVLSEDGSLKEFGNDFINFTLMTVFEVIVKPISRTFKNLFVDSQPPAPTLVERIILLSFGYGFVAICFYKFMNRLTSGNKPVMGTPRKIYKVLFEISSTAKVFLIFAIEIFFFPVYCGWLLDFCVAPLLLPNFAVQKQNSSVTFMLLYSSSIDVLQINYVRIALYWGSGTLYMLFFALFVGMIRGKILRPGVLFFIRSPDDPNARLIHDALVKPLMLQLSRICLSAKVYSGFVFIGIGGVTWSLRYLVTPSKDKDYNVLLPLQIYSLNSGFISSLVIADILFNRTIITKYCHLYWNRVFEISTHKLRLSHFILGKPISQERGYILYRNVFQQLLGVSQPDYSRPMTYKDAMNEFKENPSINASFVPDGNYVRAPDNDTVSRKFIKKLFVSVTKDDKLLSLNENRADDDYESSSSDDETNNDNAYTIVYRPPNFKLRCFALIGMLWVFAVILLVLVTFFGLLIGRPVVKAFSIISDLLSKFEVYSEIKKVFDLNSSVFDWRLADLSSIFIGLKFELSLLQYIDKKINSLPSNVGGNEVPADEIANERGIFDIGRELIPRLPGGAILGLFLFSLTSMLWVGWTITVHKWCIDLPLRLYTGYSTENSNVLFDLLITKYSIALHMFVSFWTVIPHMFNSSLEVRNGVINDLDGTRVLKNGLVTILTNFGLLHLPALALIVLNHKGFRLNNLNETDIFICSFQLVVFIILKLSLGGYKLYNNINEKVKVDKYVRGRAIENIDSTDDE